MNNRCSCGGPMLPLIVEADGRSRFAGRVCATCRKEDWYSDPRDGNLECSCSTVDASPTDSLFIRWYHRVYYVGSACIRCGIASWRMDKSGAELHFITEGIATVR